MVNDNFAARIEALIAQEYRDGKHSLGWRLLYSPAKVLERAEVAFIGLNPGGRVEREDHGVFAMAQGSAYVDESWKNCSIGESPLQRQARALFRGLRVEPADVLAGNLVPFRSRSWDSMSGKAQSLCFGQRLWGEILAQARPRLVVTMGREATSAMAEVLKASDEQRVAVGWGNITGARFDFDGGRLVGLPHLSRFGIMTRQQSAPGIQRLFEPFWRG